MTVPRTLLMPRVTLPVTVLIKMVGRSVETEIPADTIRTSALSNVTRALRAGGRNVAIFALTSMLLASAVQSPLPKTVHITYHILLLQCSGGQVSAPLNTIGVVMPPAQMANQCREQ